MFCDFHTHILPGIDDGAQDLSMSLRMLEMLNKQGIEKVVATPHFYAHRQPIEEFLQMRSKALSEVLNSHKSDTEILTGAEVYLERDIRKENLRPLCMQGTPYLLIEMPYMPYAGWMLEEVYELCLKHSIQPIFAHLDRYFSFYNDNEMQDILNFDNAIIQVNNSALFTHKTLKIVLNWIKEGRAVIMGSDCHNVTSREPNNAQALSTFKSKLGKSWLEEYSTFIDSIFEQ